jgi:beta-lactam-binding protein with PASTA domain
VTIWVSSSDTASVAVPDVGNTDVVEAVSILEEAGFVVVVLRECPQPGDSCVDDGAVPGRVWRQDPEPEEMAPAHSQVRVWAYPDD